MSRLLKRYFEPGDFIDVRFDKEVQELANDIIEVRRCKELNWAILDYAATVCRKRNPLCGECVLNKFCKYYAQNRKQSDQPGSGEHEVG